jgi:S1-C subfamily serine protease
MTVMARAVALSILILVVANLSAQELGVLHIKVVLPGADLRATPVPRHALLISDNPATASPRRVVTGSDGTANVRLRPGNYTVESDQPVAFLGKAYQWAQTLDVVAGRDTTLELTADNAEIEAVTAATPTAGSPATDPSFLLSEWQASVVSISTPTAHAPGFQIDANGLVATSRRALGSATLVEVQLTRAVKVAARAVPLDPSNDVALLRIDATTAAKMRPVALQCARPSAPRVEIGQKIFAIGGLPLQPNDMTSGTVSRVGAHLIASDLLVPPGSEGGPVFTADGVVVGISSVADDSGTRGRSAAAVVSIDDVCEAVAAGQQKLPEAPPGAQLPVEPARRFPVDTLKKEATQSAIGVTGYQLSSSDFDVTFITPALLYAARRQMDDAVHRERTGGGRGLDASYGVPRQLIEFGNWSDYVAELPSVLLVRVTPRLVEGFWTKVARGAAMTQGMSLPAITHLGSRFSRLRMLCDDHEVAAVHPFRVETRVSETETISEGLYVFDPGALAPSCAGVKLVVYSQKQPEKADTRAVDLKLVQRIWDDFAPYRAQQ